jgi:RNA-binding protein
VTLTESQKKLLRGLGHQLKPTIIVGDGGVSESLLRELDATIRHHELIKIRVRAGDRKQRDVMIAELCGKSGASLVTRIGNVALVYRRNDENPRIPLPVS